MTTKLTARPEEYQPCQVRLEPAPATPAQMQAWRCLWQMLLAEEREREAPVAAGKEAS